jgi:maltodextrin utilization protein YvdJ
MPTSKKSKARKKAENGESIVSISIRELRLIIREEVDASMDYRFKQVGIDPDDYKEVQADIADIRWWRKTRQELTKKVAAWMIIAFLGGIVTLVVLGLQEFFVQSK